MITSKNEELFPNPNGGVNNLDKPKRKRKLTQGDKASKIHPDIIQEIWDYWVEAMQSKKAILDTDRVVSIGWAVHDYGVDACKQAIDACAKSNGIGLIFRNAEKVEYFLQRSNKRDAGQEWIDEQD
jgi:hypothetical protein